VESDPQIPIKLDSNTEITGNRISSSKKDFAAPTAERVSEIKFQTSGHQMDSDDDDRWAQGLRQWNENVELAQNLEAQFAKKVMEMIPLEETLEQELDNIIKKLKEQHGGNGTPRTLNVQLMPHQITGLAWMIRQELNDQFHGGILADDMGMGKTIQTLALIHQHRFYPNVRHGGTLIVAPVALIHQWEREIVSKSSIRLKVCVYHGPKKISTKEEMRKYDVVITTYSVLSNETPREEKISTSGSVIPAYKGGILFKAAFQRIILDEAQVIKNHRSAASIACAEILTRTRFSLSGTPIQNSIDDIFSQFRFLRVPYWGEWETFYKEISAHIRKENLEECKGAIQRVQAILKGILLRRTKYDKGHDGNNILVLPDKVIREEKVALSVAERRFYDAVEGKASSEFDNIIDGGVSQVSYSSMLVLLLRLRQASSHPQLIKTIFEQAKKGTFSLDFMNVRFNPNAITAGGESQSSSYRILSDISRTGSTNIAFNPNLLKVKKLLSSDNFHRLYNQISSGELNAECPLCFDVMNNEAFTKCGHVFCKDCIDGMAERTVDTNDIPCFACPICRKQVRTSEVYPLTLFTDEMNRNSNDSSSLSAFEQSKRNAANSKEIKTIVDLLFPSGNYNEWLSSTKLDKMIEVLKDTRKQDRSMKTVVFSQWTSFLDLAQTALTMNKFAYVRVCIKLNLVRWQHECNAETRSCRCFYKR
jgi:SNF2 family DNA or RNA helicase